LPEAALDETTALLQAGQDAPVWLKIAESMVKVKPVRSADIASRFRFEPSPQEPA
jgi:hypothetical protein